MIQANCLRVEFALVVPSIDILKSDSRNEFDFENHREFFCSPTMHNFAVDSASS